MPRTDVLIETGAVGVVEREGMRAGLAQTAAIEML